ncbi:AI-2E family transporter [Carnobacterium funditum]|uniref:AI-2E family transporter n=1 Tax=Carnobacterium funditum TaxID=2752 RepID=UPI000552324C|nr:AI-2E family transporter [Carnobacterium funditum]
MKQEESVTVKHATTWFWKWILNNKVVSILLISLLILLNVLAFSKISYIFNPLRDFISVVGLPILMAGIIYYLVNPLIEWMETKKVPRMAAIFLIFIIIMALIVWGATTLIPIIREQTMSIIKNWPTYWDTLVSQAGSLLRSDILSQFQQQVNEITQTVMSSVSKQSSNLFNTTVSGIGNVVGAVTNIFVALVTMPFILFYLLKDGENLPYHIMKVVPTKLRMPTYKLLGEINNKISQYVRGQLVVAFFVALMFWLGFAIVGLEYAVTLGVLAGFLNLIPYLGSFIAMVPVLIIAFVTSPAMLIKVLIVFGIEQTIEGRVIQPQILGSNLDIHPITIIIVLLTAGRLFGIPGVILGIPGYAVLKVIIEYVFSWYKNVSGLYEGNFNPAYEPSVANKKKVKNKEKMK